MAPLYRPKRLPCFVVTGLSSLSPLILLVKLALRLCVTHSVCAHPHPPPRPRPSGRNTILAFSIRFVKPASSFLCLSFVSTLCGSHHISNYQRPTSCPASTGRTLFTRAENARIKARCSFVKSALAVVWPKHFSLRHKRAFYRIASVVSNPSARNCV